MTIKYKVILTEEEREKLKKIVDKGKRKKINRLHSQILLNIDQSKEGKMRDIEIAKVLQSDEWDLIALGGITTAYASIKKIVNLSKKVCPKSLITIGGGILTSLPKEVMTWLPSVDFGFVGESYITFPEVLSMIEMYKFFHQSQK